MNYLFCELNPDLGGNNIFTVVISKALCEFNIDSCQPFLKIPPCFFDDYTYIFTAIGACIVLGSLIGFLVGIILLSSQNKNN